MGNSSDNDAAKREKTLMEKLLQSPHAVAIYLDLLVEIHREIVATKVGCPPSYVYSIIPFTCIIYCPSI